MKCGWALEEYIQKSILGSPTTHIHIQPTGVIDPDEELAHLLAEGHHQLMLSQDEELARQLQEEENQTESYVHTRLTSLLQVDSIARAT